MAIIKLKAGETVLVAATDPNLSIGGGPIVPDLGLGVPTHPIVLPPDPTQPLPPSGAHPDHTLPGDLPQPSHPIVLPPAGEIPPPIEPPPTATPGWELVTAWTPVTGWVVVAVPGEGTLVPTPSAGAGAARRK